MEKQKRFDSWFEVDCNDCARYWDSSCDGVPKDVGRSCGSFLATRSVILPEQIKRLEKRISRLDWAFGLCFVIIVTLLLLGWLRG